MRSRQLGLARAEVPSEGEPDDAERQRTMDKLGAHFFWGYSGALDLLEAGGRPGNRDGGGGETSCESGCGKRQQLWALQVCAGDCRHVLRTLTSYFLSSQDGGEQPLGVGIKIYEKDVELLARQLLLLLVALDAQVDLKERVELFLEVHGNLELTERGEKAVDSYARQLEDWITSLKPHTSSSLLRFFDVSELKYQEKDELLRVFKSWRATKAVNAQALWDYRARKFYGDRYDFRKNLMDWDYHMRLSGKGAKEDPNVIKSSKSIVHHVHFRRWRMAGNSCEFRDKKYNAPNRTLMSTIASRLVQHRDRNLEAKGSSITAYGYFGDIQNPPYGSFGEEAWGEEERRRLFKKINKQYQHTAVDVSKSNLTYFMAALASRLGGSQKVCHCAMEVDEGGRVRVTIAAEKQHKVLSGALGGVTLKFGTGDKIRSKRDAAAYDAVIVGCRDAHLVRETPGLPCDSSTTLYVERCKNLVEVTKEHSASFDAKVGDLARESGWSEVETVVAGGSEHEDGGEEGESAYRKFYKK